MPKVGFDTVDKVGNVRVMSDVTVKSGIYFLWLCYFRIVIMHVHVSLYFVIYFVLSYALKRR